MVQAITREEVIEAYIKYVGLVLPHKKIDINEKMNSLVDNFCIWLVNQKAGRHFLDTYMQKTFSYYMSGKNINKINENWIFGKVMRQRYMNKLIKHNLPIHPLLVPKLVGEFYTISKQDINEINQTEELHKSRFHNTPAGIDWCSENTTMFHPKSNYCKTCNFSKECIEIQEEQYPTLKKNRHQNVH